MSENIDVSKPIKAGNEYWVSVSGETKRKLYGNAYTEVYRFGHEEDALIFINKLKVTVRSI